MRYVQSQVSSACRSWAAAMFDEHRWAAAFARLWRIPPTGHLVNVPLKKLTSVNKQWSARNEFIQRYALRKIWIEGIQNHQILVTTLSESGKPILACRLSPDIKRLAICTAEVLATKHFPYENSNDAGLHLYFSTQYGQDCYITACVFSSSGGMFLGLSNGKVIYYSKIPTSHLSRGFVELPQVQSGTDSIDSRSPENCLPVKFLRIIIDSSHILKLTALCQREHYPVSRIVNWVVKRGSGECSMKICSSVEVEGLAAWCPLISGDGFEEQSDTNSSIASKENKNIGENISDPNGKVQSICYGGNVWISKLGKIHLGVDSIELNLRNQEVIRDMKFGGDQVFVSSVQVPVNDVVLEGRFFIVNSKTKKVTIMDNIFPSIVQLTPMNPLTKCMVVDKINGRIHLVSENKSNSITVGLQIVDAVMIEAVIIVLCSDCLRIYDSISLDFLCILTIPLRLRRRQRITKEAIAEEAAAGNKTFVHGKIVDVDVRRGLIIVRWGCYQIHVWNMGSSINRLRKDTLREGQNKKSSKTTADRVERRFHLQKDLVEHLEVLHDHNEELAQNHKLVQAFGLSDLTEEEMLEYAKFLSVETRSREENAYETNVASDDSNLVEELNKDKYLNLGNVNKRSAFNENEDEDFQLALKMSAFDF